jgi:hypothetical protein
MYTKFKLVDPTERGYLGDPDANWRIILKLMLGK